jgi:hypothetical protein
MSQASFFSSRAARTLALVFIFGAALAIRLYDLTDLPLDFHPTRQLVSAIKARGLYYETQPDGISTWHLETAIRQASSKPMWNLLSLSVLWRSLMSLPVRRFGSREFIPRCSG